MQHNSGCNLNQSSSPAGGFIYLLLANVSTSLIPVAVKLGLRQETSPFELVVFRVILAALVLWLYFLCFRSDAFRIDRAGLIGCMLAAMTNCASMFCYFLALSYIDASLTIVVYATAHIPAVILLLMVQGEFPTRLDLFRFLTALLGIYLFIGFLGNVNLTGVLLATATAFFFGIHVILIQFRLSGYASRTVTLYVTTCMAALLSAIYLAYGYRWPSFDAATWGIILWIAVIATAIARLLLFAGIKRAGSRQAALVSPLDTLLSVLFAVWLLGERLILQQWLGTSLVVVSVALGAKAKLRTR